MPNVGKITYRIFIQRFKELYSMHRDQTRKYNKNKKFKREYLNMVNEPTLMFQFVLYFCPLLKLTFPVSAERKRKPPLR